MSGNKAESKAESKAENKVENKAEDKTGNKVENKAERGGGSGSVIIERACKGLFTLVAEIGVNYYDIASERGITPMEAAELMIDEAREAGVHAVKFQTYKAGTLSARQSPYYWDISEEPTRSQYELFSKFDSFGREEYARLAAHCAETGVEFLSTAFDFESADYLEDMMQVYKISSSDLTNLPFIEYQAAKNKPVLLSTGASDLEEIREAVKVIRSVNSAPLALLHCVLEYPTPVEHANLLKISSLAREFPDCIIGYSDHTRPSTDCRVLETAYNLGAVLVEKHFTLDKTLKGNDHYHAMDPEDVRNILRHVEYLDLIRGNPRLKALESEAAARSNARRSIVTAVDIGKDQVISEDMLTFKRPGTGISPSRIGEVAGKKALRDLAEDTILTWEMVGE